MSEKLYKRDEIPDDLLQYFQEVVPDPVPALILDPFCGTATTLEVARALGRDAIGFDLSFPYLRDQARERLSLTALDAWLMDQGRPGGEVTVEDLLGGGK